MDTLNLILATAALLGFVGLAFLGGWELGNANGVDSERALANRRVNGILREHARDVVAYENNRRPNAAKNRRKAARKAVRA
jgi:hypothetical protein